MHSSGDEQSVDAASRARSAGAGWLADALQASRRDTVATFEAYQATLGPAVPVPCAPGLNPPQWELGHIGWFQEFWIARNPQRHLGLLADPDVPRPEGLRVGADALYDSSRVAHGSRWQLALPDARQALQDLAAQLGATLRCLAVGGDDTALYFHRLSLLHEDMHHEAALYMARSLGIPILDPRWQAPVLMGPRAGLAFAASTHAMRPQGSGFAFDNEFPGADVALATYHIDSRVLSWADYLPFVEGGGYQDRRHWSPAGQRWLTAVQATAPQYLRRDGDTWLQQTAVGWKALELAQAAEHLCAHEAEAWCRWAGRRLPTEAEWEHAALQRPQAFDWGQVWEWTASPFAPFTGFTPHPYRDYSQPWFDGRPVLRGASYLTQPRMRHRRYRNFFSAERRDVAAGFRTCALAA